MFGTNYSKYDFGDRIAKRRKECGFRAQVDLAEKMVPPCQDADENARNVESKRKAISNWESGKAYPPLQDFALLCETLDCDPQYLLGDINVPRKETKSVMEITGLSQKATNALLSLRRNNKVDWGLDTLNFLLESEGMEDLLYFMTAFSTAGNRFIDSYPLRIKQKDIFQMRMNDTIKKLADGLAQQNAEKPDYRYLYKLYLGSYIQKDKTGNYRDIDEIKEEMENEGLEYDPLLFEGRERNG